MLRDAATRSERLLWERLRAGRFDGLKFRRQHPFGPFVIDFYCIEPRLAVEIDGGAHDSAAARRHDLERQALIEAAGVRVLRIRAEDVEADIESALSVIRAALASDA